MSFTNYLEEAVLNHCFRNTALPTITPRVGLFTVAPTDAGGGTEVTGGGYARQAVTFGAPTQVGEDASVSNTNVVRFTRTVAPVNVVAVGVFDAATAGNLIAWQPLASAPLGDSGGNSDVVELAAGQLTVILR